MYNDGAMRLLLLSLSRTFMTDYLSLSLSRDEIIIEPTGFMHKVMGFNLIGSQW